ncbi:MAG: hypothetical protein JST85_08330 [Acidobacteria bacterium]|nr:hypothetical protein [Acidobacteriota bacterium]
MRIILIEDDYMQEDWIGTELESRFVKKPEKIFSEFGFREQLNQIIASPPDIFVVDIMLPWTEVGESDEERPDEVKEGGKFRAGFRCIELLARYEKTRNIPIILYSAMAKDDLKDELRRMPSHVRFIPKDSDIQPLIDAIREAAAQG